MDVAGHPCGEDLVGADHVVFDGVTMAEDLGVLAAWHGADDGVLDIAGEAGGDAVAVDPVVVVGFWFQEDAMRFSLGEADDFVFDAWAVAWACGFDLACEHGRAVEVGANEVVGL